MMDEHCNEYVGTVYVLPETRCFELHTTVHGAPATITGTVSQLLASQFSQYVPGAIGTVDPQQVALRPRRVEVLTRELHERHRAPRKVHLLTRVHDVEEQARPVPVSAV
jgi:hypothetical protein